MIPNFANIFKYNALLQMFVYDFCFSVLVKQRKNREIRDYYHKMPFNLIN